MKHLNLTGKLLAVVITFFITSCGSNEQKTTTETENGDTATTAPASETSVSTITTAPQTMMVVRHKVADYAKWLASYEMHDSMRLASGLHNYVIGRGVEDPNTVLVAVKADDIAKAKAFGKAPDLKEAMKKSGVIGMPKIMLVTSAFRDTADLRPDIVRSMTIFTVKDFDAWKKAFESNRQIRTDNGITDRVYSYDVDDNHKVTLVVAIIDSAKANAFWKSDQIKKLRAESGVVGTPERFNYRIVKKY